MKHVVVCAW